MFSIGLMAMLALSQARAQDQPRAADKQQDKPTGCSYTIAGKVVEVPVGTRLCWLSPPPYSDYGLLQCGPPLNEIAEGLKRGDPRCDRYEDRR
jgi:hypothetical protein